MKYSKNRENETLEFRHYFDASMDNTGSEESTYYCSNAESYVFILESGKLVYYPYHENRKRKLVDEWKNSFKICSTHRRGESDGYYKNWNGEV